MKFGIKVWKDDPVLDYFKGKADFIEVMADPKGNFDFLKRLGMPVMIHAGHQQFGVNIASEKRRDVSLKVVNFARKLADRTNAKKIVLHSGQKEDGSTMEQAIRFVNELGDDRMIIENLPFSCDGMEYYGATPAMMEELLKKTKAGFCFDINHAILTALVLKMDYKQIIRDFVKLQPRHYHIGGQKLNGEDHFNFSESEFDTGELLGFLPKDAEVTLETSKDKEKVKEDLRIAKEILSRNGFG